MNGSINNRPNRPSPWRARYPVPGGKQRSRSFKTKREAERWLRDELGKLDRGAWVDPNSGLRLYDDFSEEWVNGLVGIKNKTLVGYRGLLNTRVRPSFGKHQLRQIDRASVRRWMSTMEDEGLSPSRIRQAHQVLHASLKQAAEDGFIGRNPAEGVKVPPDTEREMLSLTVEQVRMLSSEAEKHQRGAGTLITFLAWSGLRWGEVVALRRCSLNILRNRVFVSQSATEVNGSLTFGTTKNHRSRTIVIANSVSELLAAHLTPGAFDDTVFTAPLGGPLRSANFRTRVWLPAVKAITDTYPELAGLRVHDLRHTAASLAISAGGNIKAVQQMLGHKHASLTLDRYGHLYEEDLEELAARLDRKYRGAA
jgi:integrase